MHNYAYSLKCCYAGTYYSGDDLLLKLNMTLKFVSTECVRSCTHTVTTARPLAFQEIMLICGGLQISLDFPCEGYMLGIGNVFAYAAFKQQSLVVILKDDGSASRQSKVDSLLIHIPNRSGSCQGY